MKTVTVKDVARKAGVSTTTISFVMSNKSSHISISKATREKVLQAVKELGYKPNIFAQALACRKIKRLKLVGPSYIVTHLDAEDKGLDLRLFTFLKGALDKAQNKGYQITLIGRDTEEIKNIYKMEGEIGGVIIMNYRLKDKEIVNRLIEDRVPYVTVGGWFTEERINRIIFNEEKGTYEAVRYLIGLGHRRIGLIVDRLTQPPYDLTKLEGYKKALQELYREHLVIECGESIESAISAVSQLLDLKDAPTAIFASAEPQAFGVLKAVYNKGLKIPQDISIISGTNFIAPQQGISITALEIPLYEGGCEAVKLLEESLENRKYTHLSKILPLRLVVKESCSKFRVRNV